MIDRNLIGNYDGGLAEALSELRLRSLPPQYKDGDGFWLRALVLVSKRNLTEGWCVAERNAHGIIRYTKDYGMPSPKIGVVSVHPFEYLDEIRFKEVYASEEDMRHRLAMFYKRREMYRKAAFEEDEEKTAKLHEFTEKRISLCASCPAAELAWLDRERMILSQRDTVVQDVELKTMQIAVDAEKKPDTTPNDTYGDENTVKTKETEEVATTDAAQKRRRGRPRKRR